MMYEVRYEGGESRKNPGQAVDYMLVNIETDEYYAELPADNGTKNYYSLRKMLIKEMEENDVELSEVHFPYDADNDEPTFIDLLMKDSRVSGESLGEIRKNFGESLGIPQRTIESWIYRERKCPDYVANLIADRIFGKMINRHPIYRVYKIGKYDEWEIYTTEGYIDAVIEARREVRRIQQMKYKDKVEIRLYQNNPNDENADLTNCELVSYR